MDYQYALLKEQHTGLEVTHANAYMFIDPNRAIQNQCLNGFFCSSDLEMESCPTGYWCAEATVEPRKCGILSMCSENAYYEIDFTNLLLGILMAVTLLFISSRAVRSQRLRESWSRNMIQSHSTKEVGDVAQAKINSEILSRDQPDSEQFEGDINPFTKHSSIAIELENIFYSPLGCDSPVLSDISASIPAGKMTLVLGPSGCGKTSLLDVIRTGGVKLSSGTVNFHLQQMSAITTDQEQHPVDTNIPEFTHTEIASPLLSSQNGNGTKSVCNILQKRNLAESIGLVPQDDILDRKLTVREHLLFHSLVRSRKSLSLAQAHRIVNKTLTDLGIAHVADAVIGGGENAAANISGGQLKRVNIACEMVAISSPGVLLLDEPTSGLDAAVAYELLESIEQLKVTKGITIVCVLQQPRHEIFTKMDHLLLMHPCGSLVYEGNTNGVTHFLQHSLRYKPYSFETSDADFCIDVLNAMKYETEVTSSFANNNSKSIRRSFAEAASNHPGGALAKNESQILFDVDTTSDEGDDIRQRKLDQYESMRDNSYSRQLMIGFQRFPRHCLKIWHMLTHERFYRQVYLETHRLVLVRLRDRGQLLIAMIINIVMAVALSSGFSIFFVDSYSDVFVPPVRDSVRPFYPSPLARYSDFNTNDFALRQLLFFTGAALGCASCLGSIPVFSGMKEVSQREKAAGVPLSAFGIGRMLGDLPFVLTMAMVFCGTWCSFGMPGTPGDWILTIGGTAYAASSIGYLASAISSPKNASVNAIIITFLCAVFSGVEPTLGQVERYSVICYPWYLSFATWTSEATYVTWARYLRDYDQVDVPIQEGADVYGYDVSHGLGRSIGSLIALGTGIRLIVLILIHYY
jgi:ABC-type multidrug transport system ATPase subunit